MTRRPATYRQFWPYYLAEHSRPATRHLHIAGTSLAVVLLAAAVIAWSWPLALAAAVSGYGLAWISHVAVEHNRPATLRYPLWSLASDFRLCALWYGGRLAATYRRYGLDPAGPAGPDKPDGPRP
ncbi:MAG: DUF962 domain-containing protein [Alphaproteobacteria bacterium]